MFATFVSSSFVGVSSTIAVFVTDVFTPSFIVTSNDTLAFPSPSAVAAGTFTFHVIVPSSATVPSLFAFTNVVPFGAASVTFAVPSAFPLLLKLIVYTSVSPTFAVFLSTAFSPLIFATFVSGLSGISSPSSIAVFNTDIFVSLSITTSNVNVAFPPFAFTSTSFHTIWLFSLSYPSVFSSFIDVPSGILSVTVTFPSPSPLFVNVIVYVKVSPTFASALFTSFLPVILATLLFVSGVSVSATFATFFISVFVSLLTVTSKDTTASFPAFTSTFFHTI